MFAFRRFPARLLASSAAKASVVGFASVSMAGVLGYQVKSQTLCQEEKPKSLKKTPIQTLVSSPRTVLIYGDSNTFGNPDDSEEAPHSGGRLPYPIRWTTVLQRGLGEAAVVIPEGLNGRTLVTDDPSDDPDFSGLGGEGMNGERYFLPCMHSHKPLALVVIALGCNDLKERHSLSQWDICAGVSKLVHKVRNSNAGEDGKPPKVLVMSPPLCRTGDPVPHTWGFVNCTQKSRATIDVIANMCKEQGLPFVDLSAVAEVGADGIHFAPAQLKKIGEHMVTEVKRILEL